MDSLASAVAYAWYAATIQHIPAVPLCQTPRTDLHLRAENLHALELAGIPPVEAPLLCLSDIPSTTPFPSTNFALVDHNRIGAHFTNENPDAKVVAVIDHHEDEGLYKDTADPRVIAVPTGSASSLVARHLQEKCGNQVPPELATLLLSAILIDTHGLKVGGKAEDADRQAGIFLAPRSLLPIEEADGLVETELHSHTAIQEMTKTLDEKKSSVSHLNTADLLRRDYKEYTMTPHWQRDTTIQIGLASVPIGLKPWTKRDQAFFASAEQFMTERKLTVLGILTSFRDEKDLNKHGKPKHRREQLFVVRQGEVKDLAKKLFKGLEASKELKLKKKEFKSKLGIKKTKRFSEGFEGRMWKQKNVDATRKITAPVVKSVIEGAPEKTNP